MRERTRQDVTTRAGYERELQKLNEASEKEGRPFNPYLDIDWNAPENEIDPKDPRWALSPSHPLGAHEWYLSQSEQRRAEIGLHMSALSMKSGLQFEQLLTSGASFRNLWLPNEASAEMRYGTHEMAEEQNHIMMFQEFVKRSGVDTKGLPAWFKAFGSYLMMTAPIFPANFWIEVLSGEEPIDHVQRSLRKEGKEGTIDVHPLLDRVMYIHMAEEARHISFAKKYLHHNVPKKGALGHAALSVIYPVAMRTAADVIMRPSKREQKAMGIPPQVADEVWWNSEAGQKYKRDLFTDARELADDLGLRGKIGRAAWKYMGIEAYQPPEVRNA